MKGRKATLLGRSAIALILIVAAGCPLNRGARHALPDGSYRIVQVAKDGSSVRVMACPAGKPCSAQGPGRDFCVPAAKTELRSYLKESIAAGDIVKLQIDERATCTAGAAAPAGTSSSASGGTASDATVKPPETRGGGATGSGATGTVNPQGGTAPSNVSTRPATANPLVAQGSGTTTAAVPVPTVAALQTLEIQTVEVSLRGRWLTLVGTAVFLLLLTWGILRVGPGSLILGADNRYSKSKFQMALWFGVLMVAYLSALWLRFYHSAYGLVGGIDIPNHLLVISGLSALTFAGAKAVTQTKENRLAAAAAQDPSLVDRRKQPAPAPSFGDLSRDDAGQVDLGDFQMVLITVIAALTYLVQIFSHLSTIALEAKISLPDVDTTLLSVLGLGQGAYLLKKMASGPNLPPAQPDATAGPANAALAAPAGPSMPTRRIGEEA